MCLAAFFAFGGIPPPPGLDRRLSMDTSMSSSLERDLLGSFTGAEGTITVGLIDSSDSGLKPKKKGVSPSQRLTDSVRLSLPKASVKSGSVDL
ncbi:hypothetical protein Pmani_032535 [Petrolisthes manimaculis]|uniref:Uncharacterized protein n=1 Tax=Petrolisthes manimaculis TaxID=1843537 RepID=A0AAE1NRM9_9EUCA|nr:hypothetical protein Pmani_032535 [Petrolisthes manimaculis]